MIDYNLAKKLKGAGFPQKFKPGDFGYAKEYIEGLHGWTNWKKGRYGLYDGSGEYGIGESEDGFIKAPLLQELIDECKRNFDSLERWRLKWIAYGGNIYHSIKEEADNPEEAVANLWLKLNEKD